MSPKRILNNVDLSYLPRCKNFFKDVRKQEPELNFRLNRFFIEGT